MIKAVNPKLTNVINDLISEGLTFEIATPKASTATSIMVKNVTVDHFAGGNFEGCLAEPVQTPFGVLLEISTYQD